MEGHGVLDTSVIHRRSRRSRRGVEREEIGTCLANQDLGDDDADEFMCLEQMRSRRNMPSWSSQDLTGGRSGKTIQILEAMLLELSGVLEAFTISDLLLVSCEF